MKVNLKAVFRKVVSEVSDASSRLIRNRGRRFESEVEGKDGGVQTQVKVLEGVEEQKREAMKRLLRENEQLRQKLEQLEGKMDDGDTKEKEAEAVRRLEEEAEELEEKEEPDNDEKRSEDEKEDPSIVEDEAEQISEDEDEEARVDRAFGDLEEEMEGMGETDTEYWLEMEVQDYEDPDSWGKKTEDEEKQQSESEQADPLEEESAKEQESSEAPLRRALPPYRYSNSFTTAPSAGKFQRHAAIPHKKRELWYCECGKSFSAQVKLNAHVDYFTQKPRFSCLKCPVRFTAFKFLRQHLRNSHKITNLYSAESRGCVECGHVSVSSEAHAAHRRDSHPVRKSRVRQLSHGADTTSTAKDVHRCLCGREFAKPSYLSAHVRTYTGPALFRCTHCPKSYTSHTDLRGHLRDTHKIQAEDRQYACRVCAATFDNQAKLQRHKKKVHQVQRKYKCRLCEQVFQSSKEKQQHMHQIHGMITWNQPKKTGPSSSSQGDGKVSSVSFKCAQCPVAFGTNAKLNLHMVRIHGMKDYKMSGCATCGATFPCRVSLRRHQGTEHPKPKKVKNVQQQQYFL